MYEERRNSFTLRDIILQILLIVLLVLIMVWLFPTKNYLKQQNVVENDKLYTDYITSMTEAAKDYYTIAKVPTKTGDSVKMTLGEMIEEKLVLEIGGNAVCDSKESYVEVTKMDTDYQLRVELSCEKYHDYVIVTIGCKDFCSNCDQTVTSPITKPSTESTKPDEVKPQPQVATKYTVTFDSNGGSAVSSQTVESGKTATKPINPTKEGYKFVEWTLNGVAYDFDTAVKSNITLVASWTKDTTILYQYKKAVTSTYTYYSDWSDWSSTKTYWGSTKLPYSNTDEKEYTVISTGNAATGETKQQCTTTTTQEKVVADTQDATTKVEEGTVDVSIGTKYSWSTGTEITSDAPLKEYYKGDTIVSSEAEADTKYTFVTTDVETVCETRCSNNIVYIYKKQTKIATAVTQYSCPAGYDEEGSGTNLKCTKTSYTCESYGDDYELSGTSCVKYSTKEVKKETCKDVAVYKDYVKYQVRTRSLKTDTKTSYIYEWSTSSSDSKLIENGYVATGKTKEQ